MTKPTICSCVICRKITSNLGLSAHIRIVHLKNNSLQLAGNMSLTGSIPWNKGLTKETSSIILSSANKCSKTKTGKSGVKHTRESRNKISVTGKSNKSMGGYRPGSGIGKSGWYKGYWCDSSWELAWTVFHLEHGTPFTRCEDIFKYIDGEGIEREYHPDFKVFDYWIEIKGWETDKWKYKVAQFPYPDKLLVLKQTDLSEILAYVIDKYGKDFTYLYNEVREAA